MQSPLEEPRTSTNIDIALTGRTESFYFLEIINLSTWKTKKNSKLSNKHLKLSNAKLHIKILLKCLIF